MIDQARLTVAALRYRSGQATVEFALAFIILAVGVFGVIDVSHAVFERHSLQRAAEIIAHDLSVHPNGTSEADIVADATAANDGIPAAFPDALAKSGISFDASPLAATAAYTGTMSTAMNCLVDGSNNCLVDSGGNICPIPSAAPPDGSTVAVYSNQSVSLANCTDVSSGQGITVAIEKVSSLYSAPTDIVVTVAVKNFQTSVAPFNSFLNGTVSETASSQTSTYLAGDNDVPYGQLSQPQSQ